MPIFEYNGFDAKGSPVKGLKEADTSKAARMSLRRDGILATDIIESSKAGLLEPSSGKSFLSRDIRFKAFTGRISQEAIGNATRQLSTLLSAGVPMVESLTALIEQIDNENLKRIFSEIKSDVNEGAALATALEKHKIFTPVYINLVRAGEASGAIEVVLERLAEFMESEAALRSKIISGTTYPAVMGLVSGGVLIYIMTSVIPQLAETLQGIGVTLPTLTRLLLAFSEFLSSFWWAILLLMGLCYLGFRRWKATVKGRAKWDAMRLKMPVIGNISRMVAMARFARTLATLLSSGVPLLKALDIVRNVVANASLERAIDDVKDAVREGEDIATPLKKSGEFPPMMTHMIAVGERTGGLEKMLSRVALTYEQRVETLVERLTSLLQPVLILTMGGVAFLIVATIFSALSGLSGLK